MVNPGEGGSGKDPASSKSPVNDPVIEVTPNEGLTPSLEETVAAAVAKALQSMLPSLIQPQVEAALKSATSPVIGTPNSNVSMPGGTGDNSNTVVMANPGCTFKAFMDCKPSEFPGSSDPIKAMTWLTHMEKVFRTSKCAEADKVEYATNLLRDEAHFWWEMITRTLGSELTRLLTWEQFKTKFNEQYCSEAALESLEEEFMHLKQDDKSVQQYTLEFMEKSRFAEHQVNTEKRKVKRYLQGLKTEIREFVQAARLTIFQQVVDAARERN